MSGIGLSIVTKLLGPILAGLWSHLHLTRYATLKWREATHAAHVYTNEADFWRDLIGPQFHAGGRQILRPGDIVKLEAFQLTEWFPRAPGVYWTAEGTRLREAASMHIEAATEKYLIYSPRGKQFMVTGGIGTTRVLPHQGEFGRYQILCATSSGICDAGIPIVAPEDTAAAIVDPLEERHGVEADLTARVAALPFDPQQMILPARGSVLEPELIAWLSSSLHIPRYTLVVDSRLQVTKKISDFSLRASAWTAFARESRRSIRERVSRRPGRDFFASFTYASFDPRQPDSLAQAVHFITDYVRNHDGTVVYTDFDEHIRHLNARYSLADVMKRPPNGRSDFETITRWASDATGMQPIS